METVSNVLRKSSVFVKKATSNPLAVVLFIYILSVLLIGAWGNFPLNDDFYYLTQVKAFSNGVFTKSALIGPTFILQGLIGLLWSKLFGLSYASFKVLTILITILCIFTLDKILSILDVKGRAKALALLLVTFNPIFYACALTFMTENYFLLFVFWSLYHFLIYITQRKDKSLLLACILGALSIMIRQYGVVLFITYLAVYIAMNVKKIKTKQLAIIIFTFVLVGCLGIFWPKFKSVGDLKSFDMRLFFANTKDLIPRLTSTSVLPYLGFFLLPFSIPLFLKRRNTVKAVLAALALPVSYEFYKMNIFKFGNTLYLEGLYARLLVNVRENLFNNVPFKLVFSYLIAVSILALTYCLLKKLVITFLQVKKSGLLSFNDKLGPVDLSLILLILGFYILAVITDRVFDRYLVNFFLILVIYFSYITRKGNILLGKWALLMTTFVCLITFLLSVHYYREMQLKWYLADKVAATGVDKYKIFIDNVYARATYMELMNNYDGRLAAKPENYHPACFVQEYIRHNDNFLSFLILYIEDRAFIKKHFPNPRIFDAGLLESKSDHFDSSDILLFDEKYTSPVYNLLGRKTFVRAFCRNTYLITQTH